MRENRYTAHALADQSLEKIRPVHKSVHGKHFDLQYPDKIEEHLTVEQAQARALAARVRVELRERLRSKQKHTTTK
jgi:hypothetical protein